ncbi:Uncharacterised protein [Acinetobacter baumannii]|nr:Uncharacterised protein [Acinetobacter baumannii]
MTLTEIKFRLITIAEKRKRPYFDMIVVKEVHEAFKNNTYHELKITCLLKWKFLF